MCLLTCLMVVTIVLAFTLAVFVANIVWALAIFVVWCCVAIILVSA